MLKKNVEREKIIRVSDVKGFISGMTFPLRIQKCGKERINSHTIKLNQRKALTENISYTACLGKNIITENLAMLKLIMWM